MRLRDSNECFRLGFGEATTEVAESHARINENGNEEAEFGSTLDVDAIKVRTLS